LSKLNKRLKKLEAKIAPQGKTVLFIQNKDESESEAMARAGVTLKDLEEATIIYRVTGV
jgi:uncharacterized coiled-coil protein SlyX